MKCEIPSYVTDFINVDMWIDSEGGEYYPSTNQEGIYLLVLIERDLETYFTLP